MSHAPFTSAGGPVVETIHACARHPDLRGDAGCQSCSNALCTACARSQEHRACPACRVKAGKAANVVDVSWRVQLLLDALGASWKAIPRRIPALASILGLSLLLPLGIYLLADPQDPDWSDAAAMAGSFIVGAFFFGIWLQPLLVLPMLSRTSKLRALFGALLGMFIAFAPLVGVVVAAALLDSAGLDGEIAGNLGGFAVLGVGFLSLPLGLVWQGRAVLGRSPSVKGSLGSAVAHFCVAALWSTVLSFAWIPAAIIVGIGVAASPVVAGVLGTVCGLVIWLALLTGMGSFAAASARYSDDLERL